MHCVMKVDTDASWSSLLSGGSKVKELSLKVEKKMNRMGLGLSGFITQFTANSGIRFLVY